MRNSFFVTLIIIFSMFASGVVESASSFLPPAVSVTVDLKSADDTGISDSDNVTSKSVLSFDISGVTAGATVDLLRNGQPVASGTAASGVIVLTDAGLPENGTFMYSARETVGGNVGGAGPAIPVIFDNVRPELSVGRAAGQVTPTRTEPVQFDVVFGEVVYGFEPADVSVGGNITGLENVTVSIEGEDAIYRVGVSEVPGDGSISVSIAEGAATDAAGNESSLQNSFDNIVKLDRTAPQPSVSLAGSQPSSTRVLPLNFAVTFDEPVTDFTASDVTFADSTADLTGASVTVTGSGAKYNVAVGGFSTNGGTVTMGVVAGAAMDTAKNPSLSSIGSSPEVLVDNVAPTVTVDQAPDQADPALDLPIKFNVVFSEPVSGFTTDRLWFAGSTVSFSTAKKSITGSGTNYTVSISGLTSPNGTLVLSLITGAAQDGLGNLSQPSTSTDNVVQLNIAVPTVSISGRVVSPDGVPIRGAIVSITSATGERRTVPTGSLGFYVLEDVTPGQAYSIQVQSRRYRFTPRVVEVGTSNLTDIDFMAQE